MPEAYSAVFIESLMNQYLSTFQTYKNVMGEETDIHQLTEMTEHAVSKSVNVTLKKAETSDMEKYYLSSFCFGAYIVLACVMWGVAEILSVFFIKKIDDRIDVSPVSAIKKNMVLVGYSLFFTVIIWVLIVLIFAFVFGKDIFYVQNVIRCINMLCLSFVAIAAGFLISTLVHSKNGRAAVVNTVALGCSFISGAFISLDYINDDIVKLSSFLPVYWFTKANAYAGDASGHTLKQYTEVYKCMGVQLLFFLAVVSIGLVIRSQGKNKADNM